MAYAAARSVGWFSVVRQTVRLPGGVGAVSRARRWGALRRRTAVPQVASRGRDQGAQTEPRSTTPDHVVLTRTHVPCSRTTLSSRE